MGATQAALGEISGLAGNTGSKTAFTYLALGSGSTAFASSQTALVTEITANGLARHAATVSQEDTTYTDDTLQLTYQWTATGSQTVKEAGVFNAASSGTMAARKVLDSSVSLTSGDTYTWTHQLIFAL